MSTAYEYETSASEAFMENVNQAARTGRRYRPLALAAMAAARAALSEGKNRDVESEFEFEGAFEAEWETTPQSFRQSFGEHEAAPSAAIMEHLGHAAAEAESNGEAFAFLAPLLPLALKALPLMGKALGIGAKMLPTAASQVAKVAPKLIKGVNAAASTLRNNPATKPLVKALPQVVRRTTADLAKQAAAGTPLNGNIAVRALANQTAQLLGNPKSAVQAMNRAQALDRKVDQAVASMIQGGGNDNGAGGDIGFGDVAQMFGNQTQGTQSAGQCGCGRTPQ
jgi:hypothetical protein